MTTPWPSSLTNPAPLRCDGCMVRDRPLITCELWDDADQMVVGCATCAYCGRRVVFTRAPNRAERAVPQEQGRPMRELQT